MKAPGIFLSCIFLSLFLCSARSQKISSDTTLANEYKKTGDRLLQQGYRDSSIYYYEIASGIYRKYYEETLNKNLLSDFLYCQNTFAENISILGFSDTALSIVTDALKLAEEQIGKDSYSVAHSYSSLGGIFLDMFKLELSVENYSKAIGLLLELDGKYQKDLAKSYNNIGITYYYQGELENAIQNFIKGLDIKTRMTGEDDLNTAALASNIGLLYVEKGAYSDAMEYYNRALAIRKSLVGDNHALIADLYNNIGVLYFTKGEYDQALEYYLSALGIRKNVFGEAHLDVANLLINIGNVCNAKNQYQEALTYFRDALTLYLELTDEPQTEIAAIYNNMGITFDILEQYDRALEYYGKALEIYQQLLGEDHPSVAEVYHNVGVVSYNLKDYSKSANYHHKELGILKRIYGEKHPAIAETYNRLCHVYETLFGPEKALLTSQNALASNLRDFDDTSNVYSHPILKNYYSSKILLNTLFKRAQIYSLLEGELDHALETCQLSDSLISRIRQAAGTKADKFDIGEKASMLYEEAVDICLKLEQETGNKKLQKRYREQAFYFAERNKTSVLQEALAGTEAQKFAGIPDSLLNLEQKLSTDIAYYEKQLASVPGFQDELKYRNRLFLLNRRYDTLILTFEKQYPEYHDLKYSLTPVTTRDIQQVMDNKTAFISYFTGDSIVAIFTVTKKNLYVKSLPRGKFPASLIRDFRKCLLDPDNSMYAERYREYAFDLYQKLIPQNLDKKIKNLIIIPDSELCLIPFESLLTYKTDSPGWNNLPYLIRKYNISYSYSANLFYRTFQKTLIDRVELSGLKDWLAFAPVFNDVETSGLTLRTRELLESVDALSADSAGKRGTLLSGVYISPLPGTETEVRTILKLFDEHEKKAKVQLGTNANEFALKSGDLRDYACIHLATHGFVNMEKPELSGILLSQDTSINEDGILFSGEIYNLKLNAMLTVLSACETGLGEIKKGEGIIGLTRALLYAGSKNIIVSLWKVADESTSELMIGFYRNMLEKTEKEMYLSGALRKAKLNMIQESRYAHPFFWSPFILIGY